MNLGLVTWIARGILKRKTFNIDPSIEPGNARPGFDFLNAKYCYWGDFLKASTVVEFNSLKI